MTREIELGEGETLIPADAEDMLFRQVPDHLYDSDAGQPASHAFGSATVDVGKPSYAVLGHDGGGESRLV